jgi:hypothetical protein
MTETRERPQAAFYPILEVSSSGEKPRTLLPVWLQKSFGRWTAYGGGGFQLDSNPGARGSFFAGAALLDKLRDGVTVGAEVFRETASRTNEAPQSGFNVGIIRDIGQHHAMLLSVGRSFSGRNLGLRSVRNPTREREPREHFGKVAANALGLDSQWR